jgi:hypothetical protein
MKFLKAIVGKTRTGELKAEGIQNQTERSRLRWFGQVKRIQYEQEY